MKHEAIKKAWPALPTTLKRVFKEYADQPSERNQCYVVGYLQGCGRWLD